MWISRLEDGEPLEVVSRRDWPVLTARWGQEIETYRLPEAERAFFEGLRGRGLTAVIIGMDGCGDCERYLPALGAAAKAAGMTVRAFDRDRNPDVMDVFETEGRRRVPVFAVFEGEREVARWIERPAVAQAVVEELRAKVPPADAPDRPALIAAWRRELAARLDDVDATGAALREVRELLRAGLHQAV